jgi:hypothetical protein
VSADRDLRDLAAILAAAEGSGPGVPSAPSWDGLLRTATRLQLSPALSTATLATGLLAVVPEPLVDVLAAPGPRQHPAAVLQDDHARNQARNVDLLDQLEAILGALSSRRIEAIPLKGSAMVLSGVWPDHGDRMMSDLDLLVADAVADEAQATLLELGYAETRPTWPSLHHLAPVRLPDRNGTVELHVRPITNAWRAALHAGAVRRGAHAVRWRSSTVAVPSPEALAAHALAHAYLTDAALVRSIIPLRTTHELWLLERRVRPVDWAEVRSLLAGAGAVAGRVVDRHRQTATALLDGDTDRRVALRLAPSMAMLRWPPLRAGRDALWRARHAFDVDRGREHYGDQLSMTGLRVAQLRTQLAKRRGRT